MSADMDFGGAKQILREQISIVGYEWSRPSVLYRPRLFPDGNAWCALYGDDLMTGVAGFGATPEEAMRVFDREWYSAKPPKKKGI